MWCKSQPWKAREDFNLFCLCLGGDMSQYKILCQTLDTLLVLLVDKRLLHSLCSLQLMSQINLLSHLKYWNTGIQHYFNLVLLGTFSSVFKVPSILLGSWKKLFNSHSELEIGDVGGLLRQHFKESVGTTKTSVTVTHWWHPSLEEMMPKNSGSTWGERQRI